MTLRKIDLGRLLVKGNMRLHYRGINELADNIAEHGLLQNLVVMPLPIIDGKGREYQIVAGHRRFLALRVLKERGVKVKPVLCRVLPAGTPPLDIVMTRVSENVAREDARLWEVGEELQKARDENLSLADISKSIGKSIGYISRCLSSYNRLYRPTRELLSSSTTELSWAEIERLMRLEDGPEQLELAKLLLRGQPSVGGGGKRGAEAGSLAARFAGLQRRLKARDFDPALYECVLAVVRYLKGDTDDLEI